MLECVWPAALDAAQYPFQSKTWAAAILAETGDPRGFITARAMVKHAGLAPREKLSGTFIGCTKLTGQADRGFSWPRGVQYGER